MVTPLKRFEEYIDISVVEAIIEESNGLECNWLRGLLEEGIRIRNTTGRYLKSDRFLERLNK